MVSGRGEGQVLRQRLNKPSVERHRVYAGSQFIGYKPVMSTLSEESRRIVASLAHRVGPSADTARIAEVIVSILQGMDAALTPIIGQQGVVALTRRSIHLSASIHPHLTSTFERAQAAPDLLGLKSVLVEQSEADALLFGEGLLITFYTLLTTLIGPSLTARLLRDVWEPSLSDTPSQENSP